MNPSPAAIRGVPHHPIPPARIQPADLLAVEVISRADLKRIQRAAAEAAGATLMADSALTDLVRELPRGPVIDLWTRGLLADSLRAAMLAHHAALLRVLEIERISRRLEVE